METIFIFTWIAVIIVITEIAAALIFFVVNLIKKYWMDDDNDSPGLLEAHKNDNVGYYGSIDNAGYERRGDRSSPQRQRY